jgi:hypothetical protein
MAWLIHFAMRFFHIYPSIHLFLCNNQLAAPAMDDAKACASLTTARDSSIQVIWPAAPGEEPVFEMPVHPLAQPLPAAAAGGVVAKTFEIWVQLGSFYASSNLGAEVFETVSLLFCCVVM